MRYGCRLRQIGPVQYGIRSPLLERMFRMI